MQTNARDNYLVNEVKTAAPQKLQLLLIEAALRLANRARQYWQQRRDDLAIDALVHAQTLVAEMLGHMDSNRGGDVVKQVSAVYEFIYRSLVKAGHRHDEKSLDDATRVLEIERETWRQVCEKITTDGAATGPAAPHARFGAPHTPDMSDYTGGFSLEV